MSSTAFDTLAAARTLEGAGVDRKQAEAIAQIVRKGHGELATREFLRAEIAALETRLVRWIIGVAFGGGAPLFAALRWIP